MPTDILLIASSFEDISLVTAFDKEDKGTKFRFEDNSYPLGLMYLHSYLESCENNVRTLALNHMDFETCFEKIINTIEQSSPKLIGLQILTPNRVSSYRIIEYVHEHYPHIQLVVGGIHATLMYQQLLEKYPFIVVILGEGEITFGELADVLDSEIPKMDSVNGIAFTDDDSIVVTKQRDLIENLDVLPFPNHELFFTTNSRNTGHILTSRGCPFNCSFCALDAISRKKTRVRSVQNVVDEIEHMIKTLPSLDTIFIQDDTFFLDNDRVIAFCDEIIRREITIQFKCSGRIKPLKKEMIKKLEQANFVMVLFGLESGDNGILQACHKQITQKDAINAITLFSHSPIEVVVFLIVGLPGETIETVKETIRFVKKLQRIKYMYFYNIGILTVYPGTEVCRIAKDSRMMTDDLWISDEATPIFTVEHNITQLFEFKDMILDNISFNKFVTPAGFRAQFTMVPHIIKYVIRYRFKDIISNSIKRLYSKLER